MKGVTENARDIEETDEMSITIRVRIADRASLTGETERGGAKQPKPFDSAKALKDSGNPLVGMSDDQLKSLNEIVRDMMPDESGN